METVKPTPSPKSTYETPEERAKRQLWMARNTAVSVAANILASSSNISSKVLLDLAYEIEQWITRE